MSLMLFTGCVWHVHVHATIMIYYASWQHKFKRKHTYIKLQQEMTSEIAK